MNFTITFIVLSLALTSLVLADKVPIPIPYIPLKEPGQLAIVAWNEGKEVLILSTQLYVSILEPKLPLKINVVEIIPLPSEAKVEAGSTLMFYKLLSLLKSGLTLYRTGLKGPTSVEVVFKKVIGPHKIALIKAESASDVVEWVVEYARSLGVTLNMNLTALELALDDYIERSFDYFVVDVIDLRPYIVRPQIDHSINVIPLVYEFNSPKLYYPLKITRAGVKGWTDVKLFLITSTPIERGEVEALGFKVLAEVVVKAEDVFKVCGKFKDLFQGQEKLWVTVVEYRGDVDGLAEDLWILPKSPTRHVLLQVLSFVPIFISLALTAYFLVYHIKGKDEIKLDRLVVAMILVQAILIVNFAVAPTLTLIKVFSLFIYEIGMIFLLLSINMYLASAILGTTAIISLIKRDRSGYALTLLSCLLGIATLALLISASFLGYVRDFFGVGGRLAALLMVVGGIALPLELGNIALIGLKVSKEVESSEERASHKG